MSANDAGAGDEEAGHSGSRVQPFSTPMREAMLYV